MAKCPWRDIQIQKAKNECTLSKGDKIAILPLSFLRYPIFNCRWHVPNMGALIGRYCFAFIQEGVVCAINRSNANNNEFVPFILPSIYITSFLLNKRTFNPTPEQRCRSIVQDVCYKIAQGIDITTALQSNKVYVVQDANEQRKVDIIADYHSINRRYCNYSLPQVLLSMSDIPITFENGECLIGTQKLDKQVFDDYFTEQIHYEKEIFFGNPEVVLPSQDKIKEWRDEIHKKEQATLLREYERSLYYFKEEYINHYKKMGRDYCERWYHSSHVIKSDDGRELEIKPIKMPTVSRFGGSPVFLDERTLQDAEKLRKKYLSDIAELKRKIDYEQQVNQKKKQEEIDKQRGWKDIGNVVLVMQVCNNGKMQFRQRSINTLQKNTIQGKFRIAVDNTYWDLKRVDISTSIFKTHYVYQVEQFSHFYILEDLSKREDL